MACLCRSKGLRPRRPLAVVAWCSAPPGAWRLVHRQRLGGLPPLTLRGKPHAALTTRGVCHNESSHRGGLWEQEGVATMWKSYERLAQRTAARAAVRRLVQAGGVMRCTTGLALVMTVM